jgi:hypothetical protein
VLLWSLKFLTPPVTVSILRSFSAALKLSLVLYFGDSFTFQILTVAHNFFPCPNNVIFFIVQGGLKLKISAMTVRASEDGITKGITVLAPKEMAKEMAPVSTPKTIQATAPSVNVVQPPSTPDKKPQQQSPSMSRLRPRKKEDTPKVSTLFLTKFGMNHNIVCRF